MVEPKAPAAARIMAANALLDRGWGKAAQLVDVQGEVRQLIEVRLNVVDPKRVEDGRNIDATCSEISNDITQIEHDGRICNPTVKSDPSDAPAK